MAQKNTEKSEPKALDIKKPKRKKRKSKKKKSAHYVNAKDFQHAIEEYYKQDTDEMSHYLGETIYKISTGLSFAPNFINYTYKEDMIGDAILKMLAALRERKFKVGLGYNPFSYFTTIAYHAFVNRIKKEKKYRETIDSYQQEMYSAQLANTEGGPAIYVTPDNVNSDELGYNEE